MTALKYDVYSCQVHAVRACQKYHGRKVLHEVDLSDRDPLNSRIIIQ